MATANNPPCTLIAAAALPVGIDKLCALALPVVVSLGELVLSSEDEVSVAVAVSELPDSAEVAGEDETPEVVIMLIVVSMEADADEVIGAVAEARTEAEAEAEAEADSEAMLGIALTGESIMN